MSEPSKKRGMDLIHVTILILVIICFLLPGCEEEVDESKKRQWGQWPTSEWETNALDAVGIDSSAIRNLVQDIYAGYYGQIHSLLIVRNRFLVSENYFRGSHVKDVHQLQSVTKSVSSVLTGIAIDKGYTTEEEKILDILDNYTVQNRDYLKEQVSVKNVLTMKHGLEWHEWGYPPEEKDNYLMMDYPDWVQYVLDKPMADSPGTRFNYSTGVSVIISGIIDRRTEWKTELFASMFLFQPIGITSALWYVKDMKGHVHTGGGLGMTARDMARFGLLALNKGRWDDTQVVSESYLTHCFKVDTLNALSAYTGTEYVSMHYGYQWWIIPMQTADNKTIQVYAALGKGGQSIFILKEYGMVVVLTAWELTYSPGVAILKDVIIPAILN